jgi:hypothetical protein
MLTPHVPGKAPGIACSIGVRKASGQQSPRCRPGNLRRRPRHRQRRSLSRRTRPIAGRPSAAARASISPSKTTPRRCREVLPGRGGRAALRVQSAPGCLGHLVLLDASGIVTGRPSRPSATPEPSRPHPAGRGPPGRAQPTGRVLGILLVPSAAGTRRSHLKHPCPACSFAGRYLVIYCLLAPDILNASRSSAHACDRT